LSKLKLKDFKAYPNPTDGKVQVNFKGDNSPAIIQVIDAAGKSVYKETLNDFNGVYNKELDLRKANSGPLFLYIIQNQKVFTDNIIIE